LYTRKKNTATMSFIKVEKYNMAMPLDIE